MIQSVKDLKKDHYASVENKPGVYTWWFHHRCIDGFLKPLGAVDTKELQQKEINGEMYFALYYGIAKDCRQRA